MVKIRLKRMGAKKAPFYRVVVAESTSPRDGRHIEQLGYYDPMTNPATVKIDAEKQKDGGDKKLADAEGEASLEGGGCAGRCHSPDDRPRGAVEIEDGTVSH